MICQIAGILQIDPGPFTLRDLCQMVTACCEERWNHTASILCILANAHRDPKKHTPFTTDDFHPFRAKKEEPALDDPELGFSMLKKIFVDSPASQVELHPTQRKEFL